MINHSNNLLFYTWLCDHLNSFVDDENYRNHEDLCTIEEAILICNEDLEYAHRLEIIWREFEEEQQRDLYWN